MAKAGGWCITIKKGDRLRLFMVANPSRYEAERLAMQCSGGGLIVSGSGASDPEIEALNMAPNEVKESADLRPGVIHKGREGQERP